MIGLRTIATLRRCRPSTLPRVAAQAVISCYLIIWLLDVAVRIVKLDYVPIVCGLRSNTAPTRETINLNNSWSYLWLTQTAEFNNGHCGGLMSLMTLLRYLVLPRLNDPRYSVNWSVISHIGHDHKDTLRNLQAVGGSKAWYPMPLKEG